MKKFFTLIAVAAVALTASAQTTYSVAGKTTSDFTFVTSDFTTGTVDDNGTAIPCFNYIKNDKSKYSSLVLKDTPITFQYKNSSTKNGFYRTYANYFNCNGKGSQIQITTEVGKVITIKAAGKNDDGAAFEVVEGATADASNPTDPIGKQTDPANFTDLKFTATAATVIIKEFNAGFNLASITIADAGTAVEAVAEAKAEKAAPVKVIGKNGIQIGNYNVAGQQVK